MDFGDSAHILRESLVFIATFFVLLTYVMHKGKYVLISLILGLYIALLVSLKFPYYQQLSEILGDSPYVTIIIFIVFTFIGTVLFRRLLPESYEESKFEDFGKKLLLAFAGTVLVMAYSFHVLPITALIDPGASVATFFGPESNFFWWLIIPIIVLFLV